MKDFTTTCVRRNTSRICFNQSSASYTKPEGNQTYTSSKKKTFTLFKTKIGNFPTTLFMNWRNSDILFLTIPAETVALNVTNGNMVQRGLYSYRQRVCVITVFTMLWAHPAAPPESIVYSKEIRVAMTVNAQLWNSEKNFRISYLTEKIIHLCALRHNSPCWRHLCFLLRSNSNC